MVGKPDIRIGAALTHQLLSVFPIFPQTGRSYRRRYKLLSEALGSGELRISELQTEANVNRLCAEVIGNIHVLIYAGELLRGGKKDRVVNSTVLLSPNSTVAIPVSCVERGRWQAGAYGNGEAFVATGAVLNPEIRSVLDLSVTETVISEQTYDSDQNRVWQKIDETLAAIAVKPERSSYTEEVQNIARTVEEFLTNIEYPESAIGLCIFLNGQPRTLQLYSGYDACQKMWSREVAAAAIDAVRLSGRVPVAKQAQVNALVDFMAAADRGDWSKADTPGISSPQRTLFQHGESDGSASLLMHNDDLMHLAITC